MILNEPIGHLAYYSRKSCGLRVRIIENSYFLGGVEFFRDEFNLYI